MNFVNCDIHVCKYIKTYFQKTNLYRFFLFCCSKLSNMFMNACMTANDECERKTPKIKRQRLRYVFEYYKCSLS